MTSYYTLQLTEDCIEVTIVLSLALRQIDKNLSKFHSFTTVLSVALNFQGKPLCTFILIVCL